jgi:serine/threonine-protein kinase HipA
VPSPVLAITRFDRNMAHEQVQRIHIIDGCQVLDMPVSAKYERNMGNGGDVAHICDGVSFERLLQGRAHLELPAVGVQRLVLWATTTLLLGNSDAHGKNISFYCGRAGLRVAELYDLVSVVQYDAQKYEHALAMAFGDAFTLSEIRAYTLADFCVRSGIPRAYFVRELTTLCKIALEELQHQALDPSYLGEEVAFVRQIADFVQSQAIKLLVIAPEISRLRHDDLL